MKRAIIGVMLVAGLCLLGALPMASVHADPPPLPHSFYGAVQINGEPAPIGTQVEARGTGVLTGVSGNPLTVTQAGKYGGAGGFDPKLAVQGYVAPGTAISFYINGSLAQCATPGGSWQMSYPFSSGAVTELDLKVGEAGTDTPTPTATGTATDTPTPTVEGTVTNTPTPTSTSTSKDISVNVVDDEGHGLAGATVRLYRNGVLLREGTTNFTGWLVWNISPVMVSYRLIEQDPPGYTSVSASLPPGVIGEVVDSNTIDFELPEGSSVSSPTRNKRVHLHLRPHWSQGRL